MPWSVGSCRFSQPEICSGDHCSASLCATRHLSLPWRARRQSFGRNARSQARRSAPRDLLALLKPQRSRSSPARLRSNATIESQDTIDTTLVLPLKRPSDIRHTLTVLPALPKLSPLLRREPYPCSPLHRTPPPLARLEGVASTG